MLVSVPYRGATFLNSFKTGNRWGVKRVSVPYRGATFLNYIWKLGRISYRVSVPYRGATFLNTDKSYNDTFEIMFPSPIGELHFSIGIDNIISTKFTCFRPLSGSYISQSGMPVLLATNVCVFPSPIGELHFSIKSGKKNISRRVSVSVPYRGATFLNRNLYR